jgi:hypothetical protein
LLLIAKTAAPTLIFDILHILKAFTLLQATAILKALITEKSWKRPTAGLKHHYLYGYAVDPADPHIIVVSATQSAWQAHSVEDANSLVY